MDITFPLMMGIFIVLMLFAGAGIASLVALAMRFLRPRPPAHANGARSG